MAILLLETLRLFGSLAPYDGVTREYFFSELAITNLILTELLNSKKCDSRKR